MGNNLTIEVFDNLLREWPPSPPATLTIIEVPPRPIYGPARRHRKRRVQKKWLKRYGQKVVGYDCYLGDQILIHEKSGLMFCHPDVAEEVRRACKVFVTGKFPFAGYVTTIIGRTLYT